MSNSVYPTSIDNPVDPQPTNFLNNPSHSAQHGLENDAIVALETKVGVNGSAVSSSLDYIVNHLTLGDSLTDVSVSTPLVGQALIYNGSVWQNQTVFESGGNGSDGALNVTSGTTTINLAGASLVIKNYTSISITGSGVLAFSNPGANGTIIVLRSQGNVTITSTGSPAAIDCSGLGATGGTGGSGSPSFNPATNGNGGVTSYPSNGTNGGGASSVATNSSTSTATGATKQFSFFNFVGMNVSLAVGGGGGGSGGQSTGINEGATGAGGGSMLNGSANISAPTSGSFTSSAGNTGGNGGGALFIACGGAFNFGVGATISCNGKDGSATNASTSPGGGGGGGTFFVLYKTLTANSGTVTVLGGNQSTLGTGATGLSIIQQTVNT